MKMKEKNEMVEPFVTVIMPAYNSENTIDEAIESVLRQSFKNFELIIVNDYSTDQTLNLIEKWASKDKRIKYYNNIKNSGVSYSRNFAISKALGEWIAFLDSDDIWKSNKLEKQIKVSVENPEAVLIYTSSSFIKHDGTPYGYVMHAVEKITYKMLLRKN